MKLISVIVPAYNCAPYLHEALTSVLSQSRSGFDLEVLVVDDGSTDDTQSIVRSYGDAVRYFIIPHSGFPGRVRNYGIERSRGEYIAFLDADDYWLPRSLEVRERLLTSQSQLGFVYGNFYTLASDKKHPQFSDNCAPSGDIFDALFRQSFIHTSTVLVRRRLFGLCGGFAPNLHNAEDYWLWLHLARQSSAGFVSQFVSVYRRREEGISQTPVACKLPDLIEVVTAAAAQLAVPPRLRCERVNPLRIWLAKEEFRAGHRAKAVRWLLPALLTEPRQIVRSALKCVRRGMSGQTVFGTDQPTWVFQQTADFELNRARTKHLW